MAISVLRAGALPRDLISRDFVGEDHGGIGACVLFVDAKDMPGELLDEVSWRRSERFSTGCKRSWQT